MVISCTKYLRIHAFLYMMDFLYKHNHILGFLYIRQHYGKFSSRKKKSWSKLNLRLVYNRWQLIFYKKSLLVLKFVSLWSLMQLHGLNSNPRFFHGSMARFFSLLIQPCTRRLKWKKMRTYIFTSVKQSPNVATRYSVTSPSHHSNIGIRQLV